MARARLVEGVVVTTAECSRVGYTELGSKTSDGNGHAKGDLSEAHKAYMALLEEFRVRQLLKGQQRDGYPANRS